MERYKCRFCFKSFINGRALGGHMRSHMLTPLSSKRDLYEVTERPSQLSEETEPDASSSSSDEEEEDHVNYVESETESSRMNPTRKRSKRTRKLGSFGFDFKKVRTSQLVVTEAEHHSSASDTTTEEDLAFCLIMLSRDKWKQHKKQKKKQTVEEEEEDDETDYKSSKNRGGSRGRFECETCGKVFKSYQALGGHRASHKKNKTFTTTTSTKTEHEKTEYEKVHQCPICFRVFTSGQALGGHKRSHGSSNSIGSKRELSVNQSVLKEDEEEVSVKQRMIDLNLPAPNEDDETSVLFNEW